MASWNGTPGEYVELSRVLNRNCNCTFGLLGVPISRCAAHHLTEDQRALNGLLYGRRMASRFLEEEWMIRPRAGMAQDALGPALRG